MFNNIATSYTGSFTVSVPSGSGATLGGATTVVPTKGEVSFSGLTLAESNGAVALSVASTGLTGATTNPVSVTTPAQVAFATSTVSVTATAGTATIQVVRGGGYTGPISVSVATSGGTAVAGVSYKPVNEVLNFADGQNSQTVVIPINNAGLATGVTVNLSLSNPGTNATLGSQSTAMLVIQGTNVTPPPAPLVTMQTVGLVTKKKHVTQIVIGFSGAVNATEAQSTGTYELILANTAGLFVPTKKTLIKIKSARLSGNTVTLNLKAPLRLKKSVELIVDGIAPSGLQDSQGRLIDGNHDGTAGGNAIAILAKGGATIDAVPAGPLGGTRSSARRKSSAQRT